MRVGNERHRVVSRSSTAATGLTSGSNPSESDRSSLAEGDAGSLDGPARLDPQIGNGATRLRASRIVAALALLVVTIAACSSDPLAASSGDDGPRGGGPFEAASCSTPQEGCPCSEPGKSIECGKVDQRSGDYVTCSMGYRTCGAGTWGACNPTSVTTKSVTSIHTSGLATTPTACPDPCDPYCSQFADTPSGIVFDGGGVKVTDGGLTIDPGVNPGGAVSIGFTSNSGGITNCPADRNLVGSGSSRSCTPPGIGQCQQDFHCDSHTNTCLWNGGPGYKDTTCSGVDLTIGAPCGPNGSVAPALPLCNRGNATLPTGATITLHETNPPTVPDSCTNLGAPACTYTMPTELAPGACVTLTYCKNSPGTKYIAVNAGIPGAAFGAGGPAVKECSDAPAGQRCQNNAAYMSTDAAPGCAACQTCNTTISGKVFDPSGTNAIGPAPTGANNVALAGVTVFQPAGPLVSFNDGVSCDSCASLQSPYQTAAVTDANGTFTLNNVSPGASGKVPMVVQSGRWRRKINITSADLVAGGEIVACTNNPIKDGALRLPRSVNTTTDNPTGQSGVLSDIPKTAIVVGDREPLECWVRRIGISDSEIRPRLASANTARFQLFRTNGAGLHDINGPDCSSTTSCTLDTTNRACTTSKLPGSPKKCVYSPDYTSTNTISSRSFYSNAAVMNEFTAALLPCDNNVLTGSSYSSWRANISSYLRQGGRLFMDHYPGEEFLLNGPAPLNNTALVSTFDTKLVTPGNNGLAYSIGWIPTPTAPQTLFSAWMSSVGASPDGAQTMRSYDARMHSLKPGSATIEWVRGRGDNKWNATHTNNDYSLSFSFETGISGGATVVGKDSTAVNCGVAGGTGRVIYNGMHVSEDRMLDSSNKPAHPTTSSTLFPTNCTTDPLSSEEKALEYQFFQLTACAVGGSPPPPPPPAQPPLPVVDYYRDYEATCGSGTKPVWQFFYWQSVIPTSTTQVEFRAATASTQAALPAAPPGAAPATAAIGTATSTIPTGPPPAAQWMSDSKTVHQNLVEQSNVKSDRWLRVYMRFVPDNTTTPYSAPTLTNWRQTYDCVPNE